LRLIAVGPLSLQPPAEPSRLQPPAAIAPEFQNGAAQIVFLALGDLPDDLAEPALTSDEAERARKLIATGVRHAFVAGRWLLRSVVAALAGAEPRSLELRAGPHGKLFLADHDRLAASFNLSHSGALVALALVRGRRIGIDIEAERPITDGARLARRILSQRERDRFDTLPDGDRDGALLAVWTRKEAVLKAMGTGISAGLTSVDVSADEVASAGDPPSAWSVRTLSMPAAFHGAIAIEGEAPRLVTWQAVPQPERSA
jgi:4'-phosphopantetheinyl transferase